MDSKINQKIKILKRNIPKALSFLEKCCICPRNCNVNRIEEELGFCGIGRDAIINKIKIEQEDIFGNLVQTGKIFFSSCNLKCTFCNNYKISQSLAGKKYNAEELSNELIKLQESGAKLINFISPTHVSPQILESLLSAFEKGLKLPIVYSSNGFDVLKVLRLFRGIVDIFIMDMKYGDKKLAKKYSFAFNYPKISSRALREMHSQTGAFQVNEENIPVQGLLVRHLVLPNDQSSSQIVLETIKNLDIKIPVDILLDFVPDYKSFRFKEINRKLSYQEINKLKLLAQLYGMKNVKFTY